MTKLAPALEIARLRAALPAPRLRRLIRERTGVPQTALAHELGVDRTTICRWEAGTRTPQGGMLRRYVMLLERLVAAGERQRAAS